MIPRPYKQVIYNDKITREFSPDSDDNELIWHYDFKDRMVTIAKGSGWKYQEDNRLPIELKDGMVISIKKEVWHRIIKGYDNLIIEIIES
jgi:quercetin dioxygenase-like cupin family protein